MAISESVIQADDGYVLRGTLYTPDNGGKVLALVLINSATGVRRQFYGRFADYLAGKGFAVLTYDFRGIAESRPENLRKFSSTMRDWPQLDTPAAIKYLSSRWPTEKLYLVGHSAGGNLLGLVGGLDRVDAAMFVSSQFGYWKLWPRSRQAWMFLVWHFVVPISSNIFGYVPRWLGAGQHWPRGIALELARWCRHKEYVFGDESLDTSGYERFDKAILAYSFSDDHDASKVACETLLARFPNAEIEHRHLSPGALDVAHIGHFGFFRPACAKLWDECAEWLADQANEQSNFPQARRA
jgi:predicted alpha/beta hydrolase